MGICPLFFTVVDNVFIFGSEIKSILAHPLVTSEVDLVGLDQILTFPGLVSPRTMFKNINSLKSGHYIINNNIKINEYWDLNYPRLDDKLDLKSEIYYIERLRELLFQSINYRLQADVPVGVYISGGLDSSLIASIFSRLHSEHEIYSFAIGFNNQDICESKYRNILLEQLNVNHQEITLKLPQISDNLKRAVYHAECPLKETYNTASLALSEAVHHQGIKAVLTGEGADELFAGYIGYRFDQTRHRNSSNRKHTYHLEELLEEELRLKVWGDKNILYERDLYSYRDTKLALYSAELNSIFGEFDCLNFELVDREKIRDRHFVHQRSYLDFKLRLSDHLVSDHGDRMALANSVEARYPFLDINFVEFSQEIPPNYKLRNLQEKYILKRVAKDLVTPEIINREKFAFHAPGSPDLLRENIEYINDLLSTDRIKKQGYFNPESIENLKQQYLSDNYAINIPFESDLLIIALTFGIFLETFGMQ